MKAWGLLALACAACSEVRVSPDGAGGDGGGGGAPPAQPASRSIEVRMLEAWSRVGLPGADVISSRADGSLLDRQTTGGDGTALLQVEDGGSVTTFWQHESSYPLPVRTATTYVVTPEVTSIEQRSISTSATPEEPFRLVLELQPVEGAAAYLALAQCHPDPSQLEWLVLDQLSGPTDPPTLEADVFRGCPGLDTYSVFAMAVDQDLKILGYDYVVDAARPAGAEAVHALALDKHDVDVMNVTFEGVPDATGLEASSFRMTAGLVAYDPLAEPPETLPAGTTSWQASLLRVPIPVRTTLHAAFADGCTGASVTRTEADPVDLSWSPTRLMVVSLEPNGEPAFGEGDSGDLVRFVTTESRPDHTRIWNLVEPSSTAFSRTQRARTRPSFPDELGEAYGFEATAMDAVFVVDALQATSYEAALAAGIGDVDDAAETRYANSCTD